MARGEPRSAFREDRTRCRYRAPRLDIVPRRHGIDAFDMDALRLRQFDRDYRVGSGGHRLARCDREQRQLQRVV